MTGNETADRRNATDGRTAAGRDAGDGPTRGIELTPEHPASRVGELAAYAEVAGFDSIFTSSHYNNRDPFVALSRAAAATETARLGPGVVNPYETHPVALAARVATLAEESDGRAMLGIGAGDRSTLSNLGIDRNRPLRRVLEAFDVARKLWAGERVSHDGTFAVNDAGLNFEPPGDISVFVGAQGPDMLRMAGKHADGVLVNASHPTDLEWARDRVTEGLDARADTNPAFETLAFSSVSVAEDAAAARKTARRPVAFITAGAPEPVLTRHEIDSDRAGEIGAAIQSGDFGRADELVTDGMLEAFAVAGDPESVEEQLAALGEYVDGIVCAAPLGPDLESAIALAGAALGRALD